MTDKERTCKTCAWKSGRDTWFCHQERESLEVYNGHWCRHWSETTGWDRFEKMPTQLEQAAQEIFVRMWGTSGSGPTPKEVQLWMEEYERQC